MTSPIYLRYRKYSFLSICLFLICFTPFLMPEKNSPPETSHPKKHFLHMQGQIKGTREKIYHAKIEVFTDSVTRLFVMTTDTAGWCEFELPLQSSYLIKFSAYGYLMKRITVDTHVPKKLTGDYYCEFETEMYPPVEEIDASVLKHPIANFFFNEHK